MKTGAAMMVGWASVIWTLSSKTLQSWKRFACCAPSPYASFAGTRLPFGDGHMGGVGSQYQQIPPPPPRAPPPVSRKPPPPQFASPVLDIYKQQQQQHDIVASPLIYKSALRHAHYPDNV